MTTVYFGLPWDAPIIDDATQTGTPVDKSCDLCSELITAGDRGFIRNLLRASTSAPDALISHQYVVHLECEMLAISGHVMGVCSCTGFDTRTRAAALEMLKRINAIRVDAGQGPL